MRQNMIAVKKIKLNTYSKTISEGQKFKLKAQILPKKKVSKNLKFSTSNKKVAKVSKKGMIKAVGCGTAKIEVKSTDGSNKKATVTIKVVEKQKNTGRMILHIPFEDSFHAIGKETNGVVFPKLGGKRKHIRNRDGGSVHKPKEFGWVDSVILLKLGYRFIQGVLPTVGLGTDRFFLGGPVFGEIRGEIRRKCIGCEDAIAIEENDVAAFHKRDYSKKKAPSRGRGAWPKLISFS